ncbi:MAG TPA: MBL fold metallo-hydrolase [Candidatus Acidoferrum sp.]|nr:MBL fold metallo-hydrolase [Candidatus Acidoferrum sp.]
MKVALRAVFGLCLFAAALALGCSSTVSSGAQAAAAQVQTFETAAGPVRIMPIYHASALLQAGGKNIYVDPVHPGNFDGLPQADLILITHDHPDHMDPATVSRLSKPGTQIMAPRAVCRTITKADPIANGETKKWDGWTIEAVAAYNLSRGPGPGMFYHPKGHGNGYVLTYGGKRFYFSGDTEGVPEMRALKDIDVAFVCMNLPFTMTPDEAADAVKAFHPRIVIPYHDRGTDTTIFQRDLQGTGIEVRILNWYPTN